MWISKIKAITEAKPKDLKSWIGNAHQGEIEKTGSKDRGHFWLETNKEFENPVNHWKLFLVSVPIRLLFPFSAFM